MSCKASQGSGITLRRRSSLAHMDQSCGTLPKLVIGFAFDAGHILQQPRDFALLIASAAQSSCFLPLLPNCLLHTTVNKQIVTNEGPVSTPLRM